MKRAGAFFVNPLVVSLFATILIISLYPFNFPRFKAEILDQSKNEGLIIWNDLDNNGVSDKIVINNNAIGTAAVTVYLYPFVHVEAWEFNGRFPDFRYDFIMTGDYDHNGRKEIYAFTQSNDSIFLNCVSDYRNPEPAFSNRFITTVRSVNGKTDPEIVPAQMDDLNDDGFLDLVFGISSGYSVNPRNVFTFDIRHNILNRSPKSGFQLSEILQADITGDGKNEMILGGYAPQNITKDKSYVYHDSSSWLMVLDRHLQFLFKPVEFPGRTGSIRPFILRSSSNKITPCICWNTPYEKLKAIIFYTFNTNGTIGNQKSVSEFNRDIAGFQPFIITRANKKLICHPTIDGYLHFYDPAFCYVNNQDIGFSIKIVFRMDVDLDGMEEILFTNSLQNQIAVFRNDLTNPVFLNLALSLPRHTVLSMKKTPGEPPVLFINSGEMEYTISYMKNPLYFLKWIIYLGIYLGILLFTLLIRRIQRYQLEKKYQTEKKITELQLKIVRNQMDPHFTMNAINSVIDAVNREEKQQATDNLLHFSRMYRSLVLSADKIKRTLKEEIEFTENYLALEKFRFRDKFNYQIIIDPDVNQEWMIPKMIIQSPVENAVKHGLLTSPHEGLLSIHVFKEDQHLILDIEDNGIGRQEADRKDKASTGKGLQIMDQFLDLYYKITGIKVRSEITDLFDKDGSPAGTKVTIRIPDRV